MPNREWPHAVFIRGVVFGTLAGLSSVCSGQASSDLSPENVCKTLAVEHSQIAAHPQEAKSFIELAYTLTDAGMGDLARVAAADAVRLEPNNALAFSAQGWILHHNRIGVDYGKGFDYDGSLQAFRRAVQLGPRDLDTRESLANLLEFNRDGIRYAPDAQLMQAIENYRFVLEHRAGPRAQTAENLGIDLFYAGRYDEASAELLGLPETPLRLGIVLASMAAYEGSDQAIAKSRGIGGDEQRRKDALNVAAEGLWNKRLYRQAADLMTASLPDAVNGVAISAKIQIFKSLKPFTPPALPPSDPRQPVQQFMEALFHDAQSAPAVTQQLSRHSFSTDVQWKSTSSLGELISARFISLMKKTGLPRVVMADILLSGMRLSVSASPGQGTPLTVRLAGVAEIPCFVVLEEGSWKIAAVGANDEEVGNQALFLLAAGKVEAAKDMLNWYSSLPASGSGAPDSLTKDLFTHFFGAPEPSKETFAFAAAALATAPDFLSPLVPRIAQARESATVEAMKDDLDTLLATIYLRLGDSAKARLEITRLLERHPKSLAAIRLAGRAYGHDHDWFAWKRLLAKQLATDPKNRQLSLEQAEEATEEGNYADARRVYQTLLDSGQGTAADEKKFAWLTLFKEVPDENDLAIARQAALQPTAHDINAQFVLAFLEAARGDTAEAHQGLLDAMSSAGLAEPDAAAWYGFGRIFEQYGVTDAARAAYTQSVEMSAATYAHSPDASRLDLSLLAKNRLTALTSK